MSKPENMYETPKIPADKKDLEKMQRKFVLVLVWLAIITVMAIVAVGVAAYAAIRDLENNSGGSQTSSNDVNPGSISGSGSACNQVECENGGSCFNIYPDNYMCVCVATFYGRNCQLGKHTINYMARKPGSAIFVGNFIHTVVKKKVNCVSYFSLSE